MSHRPVNNTKSDSDLPGDELLQLSQLALDVTSDACIWADQAGHILYANETACRTLGYTKYELLSMKVTDIEVYYDEQRYSQFWEEVKRSGSVRLESVHARKDGSQFPVQMTISHVKRGEKEYAFNFIRDITERKRAEEALQKSEERYRGIVEDQTELICLFGVDGKITFVNDAYCRYFGKTQGELVGCSFLPLVIGEDREAVRAGIAALSRENPVVTIEQRVMMPDGDAWQEWKNRIVFDSVGKPAGYQAVGRDITQRKLAEEALMREKYILTKSQEIAHVGDWVYDQQADEFTGSAENDRIYGYVPGKDKATRDWVLSRVYPEDRARFADFMEARAKDGKRGSIDYRIVASDGSVKDVNSIADKTVYDKAGRVLLVYGTSQDITERKRTEEALRDNEQFLNNVFDCIKDGISVLDRDLNIIRTNRTMELWHPDALPLVGKKCHSAFHGRMEACPGCPSVMAIKEKSPVVCVVPRDVAGKTVGWQEVYSFPLLDDRRDVVGVIDYVRDITERKRAEEELESAKQQAELYLDLMGHDINNMHQIALGYLELARGMPPGVQHDDMIEKPIEVLQRSAQLIRNVRKLQKLHYGVFKTDLVDLCSILADVQREYGAVAGKTVTLNLNNRERCDVQANEFLHDVFANLVGNAIKHTGVTANIVVDLDVVEDKGGRYYRVMVEDDGPGIPDYFKGKIFNRLLKGTTKAKGMGLGLYLVKSLVDSYGGRVWAEDRIAGDHTQGARFVVMLPAISD